MEWFTAPADSSDALAVSFLDDFAAGRLEAASERFALEFRWLGQVMSRSRWLHPKLAERHRASVWKHSNLREVSPQVLALAGAATQRAAGLELLAEHAVYFADLERSGVPFTVGLVLRKPKGMVESVFDPTPIADELRRVVHRDSTQG